MKIGEKIKKLRELNNITQNEMADKLQMSVSGYAKIERGISKPNLPMLERIAKALDMNITELLSFDDTSIICIISDNNNEGVNNSNFYYGNNNTELEKAHLIIQHQNELLQQQAQRLEDNKREIETLRELLVIYKKEK